jgi:flagellin-like protein
MKRREAETSLCRGVSPIIATLILAAIVVSASLVFYVQTSGMLSRLFGKIEVQIVSLDLYKFEDKVLLMVSVRNTGNKPVIGIIVSGVDDKGRRFSLALPPADPGSTVNNSLIIPLGISNLALDASGNNLRGTIYGDPEWISDAAYGVVMRFDGANDYIFMEKSSILNEAALRYTVQVWVKPEVDNDYWTGVVGKRGRNYNFWLGRSNSPSGGFVHHRFHTTASWNDYCPNAWTIPMNEWTNVALWNDGDAARTLFNGEVKTGRDYPATILQDDSPLNIGRNLDTTSSTYTGNCYRGIIRQVLIYSPQITLEEMKFNSEHPEMPVTRNLVFWLPLNEGSNDPYTFTSGNSYPITLTAYSLDGDFYTRTVSVICS